ncbi:MAG: DUF1232 domain-containing protein [Alphaproteobacteria bacterium]|nr:DUF1232 domain-containing protein [Alphaproteobacteria bacterium]MCB9927954.1 DUF1232 domain-containing protein [Alphaproteobacteria bacterium]
MLAPSVRAWMDRIKRDIWVLCLAARDPRVPWLAKALVVLALAYALSPIDLIPDFIPVLGQLDDLVLVPAVVLLAVRFIPGPVMADLRAEAARRAGERLPVSRAGLVPVLLLWLALALAIGLAMFAGV